MVTKRLSTEPIRSSSGDSAIGTPADRLSMSAGVYLFIPIPHAPRGTRERSSQGEARYGEHIIEALF
jgi:hypothetical protein